MLSFNFARWVRSFYRSRIKTYTRNARIVFALEQLEIREAPATHIWTGLGADTKWSNPNNWSGGVPSASVLEDLVFNNTAPAASRTMVNDIAGLDLNTITVNGSNYVFGGTQSLTLGSPTATGSGSLLINAGATGTNIQLDLQLAGPSGSKQFFTINSGGDLTISGHLLGVTATELTKLGIGTLTLTNDNSAFNGPITVDNDAGILNITNAKALGAATAAEEQTVALSGATTGTFTLSFNGSLPTANLPYNATALAVQTALDSLSTIGPAGNVNVTRLGDTFFITFGGTLAGTNQPTLVTTVQGGTSASVVTVTEGGSFAGTTIGQNSQLQLTNIIGGAVPEPLILNGTGLTADGAVLNVAGVNVLSGNVQFGSIAPTIILGATTGSMEFTGHISDLGAGENLTKRGAGKLILSNSNTYRGVTTIDKGILTIRNANALGTSDGTPATGTVVNFNPVNGTGSLQLDGSLSAGGGFTVVNELLSLNASGFSGAGALENLFGNNTWAGNVQLVGTTLNSTVSIGVTNAANDLTISGVISDAGSVTATFNKIGTGRLILTSANTYSGQTNIVSGIINMRDSQALGLAGAGSGTSVNAGATLQLEVDGTADSITGDTRSLVVSEPLSILGSGVGNLGALRSVAGVNSYVVPITINGSSIGVDPDPNPTNNDSYFTNDYSLTITGGINGSTLTKVGTGQLILPSANSYAGATTISQGWVTIRSEFALGPFSNTSVGDTASPTVTVQSGASLHLMPLTANIISATWALGAVTVTTAQNNGFAAGQSVVIAGLTPVGYNGTFVITSAAGNTFTYALATDPGASATFGSAALNFDFARNLVLSGVGNAHPYALINQQGALVSLGGDNIVGGPFTVAPGNVRTSNIKLNNNVGIGVEQLPSFTTGSLVITAQMQDGTSAGGFTKLGSQRLTVQNSNSFSGPVAVQQGVLRLQNDMALGLPGGGVTVQSGGVAEIQRLLVTGSGVGDAFQLTYDGVTNTAPIPFGVSALALQNTLNTTPGFFPTGGFVTVQQSSNNTYYITFAGTIGSGFNANQLQVSALVGAATATVTTLTQGDGTALELAASLPLYNGGISAGLQIWGEPLTINASIGNHTLGSADTPVTISPGEDDLWRGPVSLNASATFTIPQTSRLTLFGTIDDAGNASPSGSDITFIGGGEMSLFGANTFRGNTFIDQGIVTIENSQALGTTGVQEVQTVTIPFTVATWNLTFNGQTTTPDFTTASTATDVQAALQALTSIGGVGGTATVTLTGNVFTIVFGGTLSGFNQPLLLATTVMGVGAIPVATTTDGSGATIVAAGAQLQLAGGITVAGEPLLLNGSGVDAAGLPNVPLRWFQTGPAAVGNGQTPGDMTVSGRLTSVTVDPTDENVIYVTSAGGGAWKTTNNGLTWTPLFDRQDLVIPTSTLVETAGTVLATSLAPHGLMPGQYVVITGASDPGYDGTFQVIATPSANTFTYAAATSPLPAATGGTATVSTAIFAGSIAIAPSNPHILYLGTGEGNNTGDSYYGSGVYKSIDSGLTWTLLESPFSTTASSNPLIGQVVNKIIVDPSDASRIYVATSDRGVFSSLATNSIATVAITNATWTAGLATITTAAAHNFGVGQQIRITGMTPTSYDGDFVITSVPDAMTFTLTMATDPGAGSVFGTVTNIAATAPGVWRYDSSGAWVNLTAIVSPNRTGLNGGPPAPHTPGPDDNYSISFPQSNASWSDLSLSGLDVHGERILYAALGTSSGSAVNGVYRLNDPELNVPTLPFAWLAGDPINGPDTRNQSPSAPVNEVQTITIPATVTVFQLTFNNGTTVTNTGNLLYTGNNGPDLLTLIAALNNTTFLGAGNSVQVRSTVANTFVVTFTGGLSALNQIQMGSVIIGGVGPITIVTNTDGGPFNSPSPASPLFPASAGNGNLKISAVGPITNEVQRITLTGVASFQLTYNGNATVAVTANAASIQAALNKTNILGPWIGTNGVIVTNTVGMANSFDVTFANNSVAGADVLQLGVPNGTTGVSISTVTPGTGPVVYAAVSNTAGNLTSIQKAVDGGRSWQAIPMPPQYLNTQGNTDSVILAATTTNVFVGGAFNGVDNSGNFIGGVLESTDGGATWSDISESTGATNGVHSGEHGMTLDRNGKLLLANDGGVWRLQNAAVGSIQWNDLNGNLAVTQVNGVAPNPSDLNVALAGANDNGTEIFSGTQGWMQTDIGDGGLIAYDPKNPNIVYHVRNVQPINNIISATAVGNVVTITTPSPHGFATGESVIIAGMGNGNYNATATITVLTPTTFTYTLGGNPGAAGTLGTATGNFTTSLMKSVDGGQTWTSILDGRSIYFPFVIDSNNPSRILVGLNGLQETTDGGTRTGTGATTFSSLGAPFTPTAIAAATYQGTFTNAGFPNVADKGANALDQDTIYITNGTSVSLTKDHGQTWITRTPPGIGAGTIFDIEVDPSNRDTVYVTLMGFSGPGGSHVLKSTDAGLTWTDLSAGLPDLPTWSLAIDPRTNDLYVGNDVGIYKLTGGVGAWVRMDVGLPNVQIKDLVLSPDLNLLTAGTYGRSMYQFYLNDVEADSGALRAVSGKNVWTGTIRLGGDTSITVNGSQALQSGLSTGELNIVGAISDATYQGDFKLTKDGGGDLLLSGTNTYGGLTEVKGGVLVIQNSQALGGFRPGGADLTAQGGTIVDAGTAIELRSDLALEGIALNGDGASQNNQHNTGALRNTTNNNTFTGTLTLQTDSTIGVDQGTSLTIGTSLFVPGTGTIGGLFGIDKELGGTLILNSANTYSGTTTVNQGILQIQNSAALGSTAGGTVVLDGSQLQIMTPTVGPNTGVPVNVGLESLDISGTGISLTGAILNVGGDNEWGGPITFDYLPGFFPVTTPPNFVSIGTNAGTSLALDNSIGQDTSKPGSPIAFGLTKLGAGKLILKAANSYGEQTNVAQGVLNIQDPNALGTNGPGVSPPSPLIHDYEFNGTTPAAALADSLGGPSLVQVGGGTFTGTRFDFPQNEGLSLSNALPNTGNYTIDVLFDFDDLAGWTRILEFKNRLSDTGLYQITGFPGTRSLQFYDLLPGPSNLFTAGVDIDITLTRNATTGQVVAYANGLPQFSFIDTNGDANFTGPNGIINFFTDDLVVPGEASSGSVDSIKIYNTPLTAAQVLSAFNGGTITGGASTQTNTVVQNGAALEIQSPTGINIAPEDLILNGTGVGGTGALRNISGNNTYTGSVTLQTSTAIGAEPASQLTVAGLIQDPTPAPLPASDLTKVGTGTVVFPNANTYRGRTLVNEGVLNIQNNTALGINPNEFQRITVTGTSGSYTLTFNGQITSPILPGASGAQVAAALNALSTINAGGGSVSVAQVGNVYTVTFDGGPDSQIDQTQIIPTSVGGTSVAIATVQDGGGTGGATIVSGGTLQLQNNLNVSTETLVLNGTGFNGGGALQNLSGTNTWSGPLLLGSDAAIGSIAPASDDLLLNTSITTSTPGATFTLSKVGTGKAQFTGSAANAYIGATNVLAGTLELNKSIANGAIVGVLTVGGSTPINEVQTLNIPATVTSFSLTFNGNTTAPIPYTGVAATDIAAISTALNQPAILNGGSVTVASPAANVFTITFGGTLAGADQPPITATTLAGIGPITTGPTIDGSGFTPNSAVVQLLQPNQIADARNVNVNGDGFLNLDGMTENVNQLLVSNGHVKINNAAGSGSLTVTSLSMNAGLIDNAGASSVLHLKGPIVGSSSASSPATIAGAGGTIDLTGSTGNFNINDGPNATDLVISGNSITGAAAVTKSSTGRLEITAGASIPITTVVTGGDVQVDAGATAADVQLSGASASVSGQGNIGHVVGTPLPVGTINPGSNGVTSNTGILNSQGATWGTGTTFFVNLTNPDGPATPPTVGSEYDQLAVTGNLTLGGAMLSGTVGAHVQIGDSFTILTTTGSISGQFTGITGTGTALIPNGGFVFVGGSKFILNYVDTNADTLPDSVVLTRQLLTLSAAITASPGATTAYGQSALFTATLTPEVGGGAIPAGAQVTFTIDAGTPAQNSITLTATAGQSTFTLDPQVAFNQVWLPGTTHTIDASLTDPSDAFAAASATRFTQTIVQNQVKFSFTTNPVITTTAPAFGQNVTVTVNVGALTTLFTNAANPPLTPTGQITFTVDGVAGTPVSLTNSAAPDLLSGLSVGNHTVVVNYLGDANYTIGTSTTFNILVKKDTSSIALTQSVNPSQLGQDVTFTATLVPGANPTTGVPGGVNSVKFYNGSAVPANLVFTATPVNGVASYTTNLLLLGARIITVTYAGDTNYTASTKSINHAVSSGVPTISLFAAPVGSANFGDPATFTFIAASPIFGFATPTGTVTFTDFAPSHPLGVVFGSATLDAGGTATVQTGNLTAEAHTITATYSGDANYLTGSQSITNYNIAAATTTALSIVPAGGNAFGTPGGLITAAISSAAGAIPDGIVVNFTDSVDGTLGSAVTSAGVATFTIPATQLDVGTHDITATFAGNANFLTSNATTSGYTITPAASATAIVSGPATFALGTTATYTANVTAVVPTAGVVSGTITFFDGSTQIGTPQTLVAGAASITLPNTITVGAHAISAKYAASTNFLASTSTAFNIVVNPGPTTTTLTSSANPSGSRQSVTFTANVGTSITGFGKPTGTVTFKDGTTTIGTGTINGSGVATFTTSSLAIGVHNITAQYAGAGKFAGSTSSPALAQSVLNAATVTYAAVPSPSVVGQPVDISVTVAGTVGTPTGTVSIFEGATLITSGPLAAGAVDLPLNTLTLGTHNLTITYSGDSVYAPASISRTQVVAQAPTTIAVASNTPVEFGTPSNFTAVVSATFGGAPALAVVTFFDNNVAIGSAALTTSDATSTTFSFTPTMPLAFGSHTITAKYAGAGNFLASTSATFIHVVTGSATTTTLTPTAPTKFGQPATFIAHVTSAGGVIPSGNVTFFDGTTALGIAPLAVTGDALFATNSLSASSHSITAVYNANTNFASSPSSPITQIVNPADTGTSVMSDAAAGAIYGQTVNFTITVTATSGGTPGTPSGTVDLFDGATLLAGSLPLINGVATFATTVPLVVGTHTFTAVYSATTNFSGSNSPTFNQVVNAAATTTVLSANPPFWPLNESVTLIAKVTANSPSTAVPTGSVVFTIDGVDRLPVSVVGGQASVANTFVTGGLHTVTARYLNDTNNFTASSDSPQTQNVRLRSNIQLATSLPDGALDSESVTFFAFVTAVGGMPTGVVNFFDGNTLVGTGTLNSSGIATVTLTGLSIGTHSISAEYVGDTTFNPAIPATPLLQVVARTRIKGRLVF